MRILLLTAFLFGSLLTHGQALTAKEMVAMVRTQSAKKFKQTFKAKGFEVGRSKDTDWYAYNEATDDAYYYNNGPDYDTGLNSYCIATNTTQKAVANSLKQGFANDGFTQQFTMLSRYGDTTTYYYNPAQPNVYVVYNQGMRIMRDTTVTYSTEVHFFTQKPKLDIYAILSLLKYNDSLTSNAVLGLLGYSANATATFGVNDTTNLYTAKHTSTRIRMAKNGSGFTIEYPKKRAFSKTLKELYYEEWVDVLPRPFFKARQQKQYTLLTVIPKLQYTNHNGPTHHLYINNGSYMLKFNKRKE